MRPLLLAILLASLLGAPGCRQPAESDAYFFAMHQPAAPVDASGEDRLARVRQLTRGGQNRAAIFAPERDILFSSTREGLPGERLMRMDLDGRNARAAESTLARDTSRDTSPDGARVVYVAPVKTEHSESVEVFMMQADGSQVTQLTRHGAMASAPAFHPGGEHIIFASTLDDPHGASTHLFLMRADGTELERVTYAPGSHSAPRFSPDGTQLLFASTRGATTRGEVNLFLADWSQRLPPSVATQGDPERFSSDPFRAHVRALTASATQGRAAGSAGALVAAGIIEREFARLGLEPLEQATGYRQTFSPAPQRIKGEVVPGDALTLHNIVGRLPARADRAPTQRALILGAHYDHLGATEDGVHAGANDNASGVALLLELTQALASQPRAHDIYVVAFDGEELGMLGSDYFVRHPPLPAQDMIAMLNFDMVGRLDEGALELGGVGSAVEFLDLVRRAHAVTQELELELSFEGEAPSDHLSFYGEQVPVLWFSTGQTPEYHTPRDTSDTLDVHGALKVGRLALEIAAELARSERTPTFRAPHGGQHVQEEHKK